MNSDRGAGTLDALLAPLPSERFLAEYWDRASVYLAPSPQRLDAVRTAIGTWQIDQLAALCDEAVKSFVRGDNGYERRLVAPTEAVHVYEGGGTVYFINAHRWLPDAGRWVSCITATVGAPRGRLSIFAAREGARMPAHFDTAGGITVQIAGKKRWRIAPNLQVEAPTQNYAVGGEVHEEIGLYVHHAPAHRMPSQAQDVELEPGAGLYLPRGAWHETETLEDSLSVVLSFDAIPWADLVLSAVRRVLLRDVAWRRNAYGLTDTHGDSREAIAGELGQRLTALARELAELRVEDFLWAGGPVESFEDDRNLTLRRNPLASVVIGDERADDVVVSVCVRGVGARETLLAVPRPELPALRWLLRELRRPLAASTFEASFPGAARRLVPVLAASGLLVFEVAEDPAPVL